MLKERLHEHHQQQKRLENANTHGLAVRQVAEDKITVMQRRVEVLEDELLQHKRNQEEKVAALERELKQQQQNLAAKNAALGAEVETRQQRIAVLEKEAAWQRAEAQRVRHHLDCRLQAAQQDVSTLLQDLEETKAAAQQATAAAEEAGARSELAGGNCQMSAFYDN